MQTTTMTTLPDCYFCGLEVKQGKREMVEPAEYDAKTVLGAHAYMCQEHFDQVGTQLGTRLVKPTKQADETIDEADAVCKQCGKGCPEDSWNKETGRYRLLERPEMVPMMAEMGLYCEEMLGFL